MFDLYLRLYHIGNTVFQLNITRNSTRVDSYTNGRWIKKENG
uniref:Uncharacterized protein n=1 Tax=Meloidogyne enterolobii TaxID=390850 RepID=A0A6V7YD51_MELEN|nr:unnamed protein product [Meloidogyne enterolobii]